MLRTATRKIIRRTAATLPRHYGPPWADKPLVITVHEDEIILKPARCRSGQVRINILALFRKLHGF